MAGAVLRDKHRKAEIWLTAMLPHLDKRPSLDEFVHGQKDRRRDLVACLAAWDKVDRALVANRNKGAA